MNISVLQFTLILLFLAIYMYEYRSTETFFIYAGAPVMGGFITGLILDNVEVGLAMGGTLQLMTLGVEAFGGVSVPDYFVGSVVGTMVCTMTGNSNLEYGLTIAIPVAMLMVQLDVIARMFIAYFINQSREKAKELKMKAAYAWIIAGIIPYILRNIIPVVIVYALGSEVITNVLNSLPDFIMGSFSLAAKILPAMGLAILLRYMATKEYIAYVIIGFTIVAYLSVPILGVAVLATGLAIINYKNQSKVASLSVSEIGGVDDDEL